MPSDHLDYPRPSRASFLNPSAKVSFIADRYSLTFLYPPLLLIISEAVGQLTSQKFARLNVCIYV